MTQCRTTACALAPTHLLHFEPLRPPAAGLDIPCDPQGRVGIRPQPDQLALF